MSAKIFAANWKMNKNPQQALSFAQDFLKKTESTFFQNREIFIFPQNFSLPVIAEQFKNSPVLYGPQQIHFQTQGAFTGENSLEMAKSLGSKVCLIGHSERRQFFHESNVDINKKIILCQQQQILPVFCFGETLQQRQNEETFKVCFQQLEEALVHCDKNQRIVLAYEPVWAIGTGQVATTEQVQEVHARIFTKMTELGFKNYHILYGGSVKPDNAQALLKIPHVDGFLIGGAALEVDSFLSISK